MNCHFKINTVRFIHALHALRRIEPYLSHMDLTDVEFDSLQEFLCRVENAYTDFLQRDSSQMSAEQSCNDVTPTAGRAEARSPFGKDYANFWRADLDPVFDALFDSL